MPNQMTTLHCHQCGTAFSLEHRYRNQLATTIKCPLCSTDLTIDPSNTPTLAKRHLDCLNSDPTHPTHSHNTPKTRSSDQ